MSKKQSISVSTAAVARTKGNRKQKLTTRIGSSVSLGCRLKARIVRAFDDNLHCILQWLARRVQRCLPYRGGGTKCQRG